MQHLPFQRLKSQITVLIGIGLLGWASTVSADFAPHSDPKKYPAATCVQSSGPDSLYYSPDGSIFNRDRTRPIQVNCPLLRDYTASDTGVNHLYVNVQDSKVSWCRLRIIQPTSAGSGYKTLKQVRDTSVGTFENSKSFLLQFKKDIDFPRGAFYMIGCELKAGGRLISYSAYEEDN